MSFSESIDMVIKQFGHDIICSERFINILSDYGGFDLKAVKTVMRQLIKSGYGQKMYELDKEFHPDRNMKVKTYIAELTAMGFQNGYVSYTFDCLCHGLGWTYDNPILDPNVQDDSVNSMKKTFTVKGVEFSMVYVEGDSFDMGATPEQGIYAAFDEKPSVKVTVSSFYLGITPVSQALWKAVMSCNPSHHQGDDLPVERVTWFECQEFVKKLSAMTNENFRLPTEAEWEYAARGGKHAAHKRYAGADDNDLGAFIWCNDNSNGVSHQVGSLNPNELGIYDMSGNVSEWCADWYFNSYNNNNDKVNPQGPSSGIAKVIRGGSWSDKKMACRVSKRLSLNPNYKSKLVGLRIAKSK